jgi:hypothetical protein
MLTSWCWGVRVHELTIHHIRLHSHVNSLCTTTELQPLKVLCDSTQSGSAANHDSTENYDSTESTACQAYCSNPPACLPNTRCVPVLVTNVEQQRST